MTTDSNCLIESTCATTDSLTVWQDPSETSPREPVHSRDAADGRRTSPEALALLSSNLPLSIRSRPQEKCRQITPHVQCQDPVLASDIKYEKPNDAHVTKTMSSKLPWTPLLHGTPQCIKSMLNQRDPTPLVVAQSSLALVKAAETLQLRSKLMTTDVPLSRHARVLDFSYLKLPCTFKSRMLMPDSTIALRSIKSEAHLELCQTSLSVANDIPHLEEPMTSGEPMASNAATPMSSIYATVKISNIPWNASTEQMLEFLGKNTRLAAYTSVCAPVHFVLDRTSGKTQSEIYLEVMTVGDAERLAQRKSGRSLGPRSVTVELVSSTEMIEAFFPRRRGLHWVTPEEIQNLLTHAKTFKSPYTRKCPQRPFENFISILALFPWADEAVYAPAQVELLFMGYTSITSILQWHIRKGRIQGLDTVLLHRLVAAGTNLTRFNDEQKKIVCCAVSFDPRDVVSESPSGQDTTKIASQNSVNSVVDASHKPLEVCVCPEPKEATQSPIAMSKNKPTDRKLAVVSTGHAGTGKSVNRCTESTRVLLNSHKTSTASEHKYVFSGRLVESTVHLPTNGKETVIQSELTTTKGCFASTIQSSIQKDCTLQTSALSMQEKWLSNARKAGIVVGASTAISLS